MTEYPYTLEENEIISMEESLAVERKHLLKDDDTLITKKTAWPIQIIRELYELFIAEKTNSIRTIQDAVYLNSVLLKDALTSYFKDIHRYKNYSGSTWANKQKQAAYTIKWLVRFRPIQIVKDAELEDNEIILINLEFALFCAFSFLGPEIVDLVMQDREEVKKSNETRPDEKKIDSFYDRLLYDLRYRELSGKKLILTFDALELAVKKDGKKKNDYSKF